MGDAILTLHNDLVLFKDGPDKDFCLGLLPVDILTFPLRKRESICREYVRNHCVFTGEIDEIERQGGGSNGIKILRWWLEKQDENLGFGPITLCGHMVHAYSALCASVGIYTRLVGAVGPYGPDNQAEYWDDEQKTWVFVNLGGNSFYYSRKNGVRLSYRNLSLLARVGDDDDCVLSSPTGGLALHPKGNKYTNWTKWKDDAIISNGNAALINQPHDWHLWRVWPPKKGVESVWAKRYLVENPPMHILYPEM